MDANEYIRTHLDSSDVEIAQALGITREAVRSRRRRLGLTKSQSGNEVSEDAKWRQVADKVITALKEQKITPETVGAIKKIRVSQYQSMIKTPEGEPQVVDLGAVRFEIDPSFKDGPKWPVVQPITPTPLKLRKVKKEKRQNKLAVILPDPQIGYWRNLQTGKLDPYHDERAISLAIQLIEELRPDLIVNLGDVLDFPEFGKYIQEAGFAETTQPTLRYAYQYLRAQREAAPNAEIIYLEGNHCKRLSSYILTNAKAAFGLTQAHDPEGWPVLSVPHLLALDSLGVQYIAGYPANEYWINDRLVCVHGDKIRSSGSTAKAVADDERISMIFGHLHRIELHYKTVRVRNGFRTNLAFTPGCLCRISGVPGVRTGTDVWGNPVKRSFDWQQGLALVHYRDGDMPFSIEPIYIHEGSLIFRGRTYSA
jgi:hypothetical protein